MNKLSDSQIRILEKQELDCTDVMELVGDLADGELSSSLKIRVHSHIVACQYCQDMEESYRLTIELARTLRDQPIPSGVQKRLRQALNDRLGLNLPA